MQQHADPAEKTPQQLFRYSTWLHIGPEAEYCPEGEDGCTNPLHFHAWCRLPNQFAHREIREKALAARARRARQLRDPHSDAAAVLDDDVEAIMRQPDAKAALVDELLGAEWWKDYMEAVRDLHELEDDAGERPWQHIDHDRARFVELQAMEDRPAEEFAELERHLTRYADELTRRHEEISRPRREALEARDVNDLCDLVREQRITAEAQEEFMHTYSAWSWYAGTLTQPHGERKFQAMAQLEACAPEVIEALQRTFEDLEQTFNEGPAKNS